MNELEINPTFFTKLIYRKVLLFKPTTDLQQLLVLFQNTYTSHQKITNCWWTMWRNLQVNGKAMMHPQTLNQEQDARDIVFGEASDEIYIFLEKKMVSLTPSKHEQHSNIFNLATAFIAFFRSELMEQWESSLRQREMQLWHSTFDEPGPRIWKDQTYLLTQVTLLNLNICH